MKEEVDKATGIMQTIGMDLLLLLKIVGILVAGWLVERLIYYALRRGYAKAKAKGREEMTHYRFFRNAVRTLVLILVVVAITYTVPSLKSLALTLFAGAGILAVVIGFAAQKALSDIISGIFIVAFRPFRVGDMIQAGEAGVFGTVEDINLRHTTILTFENRRVVIPNSIIGEERIVNSSIKEEATCQYVEIPVAVDADIAKARKIMQQECKAHPAQFDKRTTEEKAAGEPEVPVRLVDIRDGMVTLRAYVWAPDPVNARLMRYDLYERILQHFVKEQIPVAVPMRHFVQQNPYRTNLVEHAQTIAD